MQAIVTSSHGLKWVTYAGAAPDGPKMRDPFQPAGHTYCWRESSRRVRHAEAQADCSNIHQGKPDRQRQSTIWFRRREVGRSSLSKLGGRPTLPNEPVALCCRASTAVYLRGRRRCGHVARLLSLQMTPLLFLLRSVTFLSRRSSDRSRWHTCPDATSARTALQH